MIAILPKGLNKLLWERLSKRWKSQRGTGRIIPSKLRLMIWSSDHLNVLATICEWSLTWESESSDMSTGDCLMTTCGCVLWLLTFSATLILPQVQIQDLGATRHPSQSRVWPCIWNKKKVFNSEQSVFWKIYIENYRLYFSLLPKTEFFDWLIESFIVSLFSYCCY